MPDRIIAATAVHLGLPLITRDRRLQAQDHLVGRAHYEL
jgi:predicted nucleic acid-binding protein